MSSFSLSLFLSLVLREKIISHIPENIPEVTFIQVGDFGIGYQHVDIELKKLTTLNEFLKGMGFNMMVVSGNHDDPKFWNGDYKFSNLWLIPDYTYLTIEGNKFLFVGGATSIDRIYRTPGKDWWANEILVPPNTPLEKVDVLVMHTAPNEVGNIRSDLTEYYKWDPLLKTDLADERNLASKILHACKPSRFYCGHFHVSQTGETPIDDTWCKWHILDIFEFKEFR